MKFSKQGLYFILSIKKTIVVLFNSALHFIICFFLKFFTYTPEFIGRTIANRVYDDHIMFVFQTPENESEMKKHSYSNTKKKEREVNDNNQRE